MFLTLHLHRTKVRDLAWDMVTRRGGVAEGAEVANKAIPRRGV